CGSMTEVEKGLNEGVEVNGGREAAQCYELPLKGDGPLLLFADTLKQACGDIPRIKDRLVVLSVPLITENSAVIRPGEGFEHEVPAFRGLNPIRSDRKVAKTLRWRVERIFSEVKIETSDSFRLRCPGFGREQALQRRLYVAVPTNINHRPRGGGI